MPQRRLREAAGCADVGRRQGTRWLAGLELPAEERESVDGGTRQIEFLNVEIKAVEELIAEQALSWPEIRRLDAVRALDRIGAATSIAAIGRPDRFLTSQARRLPRTGTEGPSRQA